MSDNSVPIFPHEAMIGSLADLARELSRGNEVPEEFLFGAALTNFGAIASGGLLLQIGINSDTRLYTALVADSYSGKKSTATTFITNFFKNLTLPIPWDVCYGVGSAEGLAKRLKQAQRLLLSLDELRGFVEKSQIKGSVLLPMTTTLFERLQYENVTKEEHIKVEEGRLGIIGCSTADTYGDLWSRESIAIGFLNRLFVIHAQQRPKVAWPVEPNQERLAATRQRIEGQFARLPAKLEITPEAKELWTEWYENLTASEQARRLDTIGLRLMPILAVTTDRPAVDADIVRAVAAILSYELQIRTLLDPVDAENTVAKVEQKICRTLKVEGVMSHRSLFRAIHAERYGTWAFISALKNLITNGDIDAVQLGLTGRKPAYRLNEATE